MTHSKMNPFIWVLIILMTLDALRELAGASSILGMAINVGLSKQ
ncbi:KPN_01571 family protein [Escherichia coli]